MTRTLVLVALLAARLAHAQASGMGFGGVCLGPRGAEEACPGESVRCSTKMFAINDTLSLFHAKITTSPAGGDQVSEFTAPPDSGITFTDSAEFAFVVTAAEADRGSTVFVRVEGEATIQEPFVGCCATGSWGVSYAVPADCPTPTAAFVDTTAPTRACMRASRRALRACTPRP